MEDITLRASSIRAFSEVPRTWYKNHILGEDKFEGNTATYLGTIVHHFAESYFTDEVFNPSAILEDAPEHVDKDVIISEYPEMCNVFEKKYLSQIDTPDHIELFNKIEKNDITFQGTCDAINGSVLVDYKTAGKYESNPKIDQYIQQLNIYAYLVSLKDIKIDTLRAVKIYRRTKTLPPRVTVLETPADIEEGKRLVNLMIDKTTLALKNPEFINLLFIDNPYSFLSSGFNVDTKVMKLDN